MAIVLEMYEYSDVAFIQDVWMVIYCHDKNIYINKQC